MSNNAAVTADGGEIGRAQALQARAARVAPSVHMNPVLLKPQSEIGAQIVVQGKVFGAARAAEYQAIKATLMPHVLDSFARLKHEADLVLVEGAGSASEVNLRGNDIANMGFARAADVPVVIVGDIDRGGVIASIVGTRAVIDGDDAAMVRGFIVNKFRGDPALFARGHGDDRGVDRLGSARPRAVLRRRAPPAGRGCAGPVGERQPAAQGRRGSGSPCPSCRMSPISTTSIRSTPSRTSRSCKVWPGSALPGDADLVILLGSKSTIADLAALREAGFDIDIAAHLRRGGHVLGLCGGYQMLGRRLHDPDGVEGPAGSVDGLGLLDVETRLTADKRLVAVDRDDRRRRTVRRLRDAYGRDRRARRGAAVRRARRRPRRRALPQPTGACPGTYVHGLFADDRQRAQLAGAVRRRGWRLRLRGRRRRDARRASPRIWKGIVDLDRLIAHAR